MIGRDAAAGEAMEVAVPEVQQPQAHRQVLLQRCGAEMLVHRVGSGQEFTKACCANGDCQGQANGRPHGIAPAHPVPKAKGGGDAKGVGCGHIGGQRGKVARGVSPALCGKPGLGRVRVGHGLNGGEGLAGDQEQRAFHLELFQRRRQFMAVHIADKVHPLAAVGKGVERQHRHLRPQVRAANADVHHVGNRCIGAHALGVGQHGIQGLMHLGQLGGAVAAIIAAARRRAQQHMPDLAALGVVDFFASEHGIAVLFHAALARHVHQQRFSRCVDAVLGQIGKHIRSALAQTFKAVAVLRKRVAQIKSLAGGGIGGMQLCPGGRAITSGSCHVLFP